MSHYHSRIQHERFFAPVGRDVTSQARHEDRPLLRSERDHELKADGDADSPEGSFPEHAFSYFGGLKDVCAASEYQPVEAVDLESDLQTDLLAIREAFRTGSPASAIGHKLLRLHA